jgi:hypothetical protein
MWIKIQPKILADYLEKAFSDGCYRLTFDDIAIGIFRIKVPKQEHIEALRTAWQSAQRQLRRRDVCAMLVSVMYFDDYARREPRGVEAIKMCIAGYGGRKAGGVRLLTMKGVRNDPMAIMYFHLRSRNVRGMVGAIEDRITVEWSHGKLTKVRARMLVDEATEPALPEHQEEFNKLMEDDPNA